MTDRTTKAGPKGPGWETSTRFLPKDHAAPLAAFLCRVPLFVPRPFHPPPVLPLFFFTSPFTRCLRSPLATHRLGFLSMLPTRIRYVVASFFSSHRIPSRFLPASLFSLLSSLLCSSSSESVCAGSMLPDPRCLLFTLSSYCLSIAAGHRPLNPPPPPPQSANFLTSHPTLPTPLVFPNAGGQPPFCGAARASRPLPFPSPPGASPLSLAAAPSTPLSHAPPFASWPLHPLSYLSPRAVSRDLHSVYSSPLPPPSHEKP